MTARDLLQQRATLPNGDTVWRHSPLVQAALKGKMAILDGIHRVHRGTLAVLHRLLHDHELQLYDGTRMTSRERSEQPAIDHMTHLALIMLVWSVCFPTELFNISWCNYVRTVHVS